MAEEAGVNYFDLFSPDPAARSALGEALEGRRESNGIHEGTEAFRVPDTEREHYRVLAHHAGECLQCGLCETRCPFDVDIRNNMRKAQSIFGY